jgi:Co/Zn/Cd efflux system component
MGLSKSTRIMILLGIDSAFFLLELVVGYAVHSLALVADSFHMVWQFSCVLRHTTNFGLAERCHIAPGWTMGSQGRK